MHCNRLQHIAIHHYECVPSISIIAPCTGGIPVRGEYLSTQVHFSAPYCTAQFCTALHCTALQCSAELCSAVQCRTVQCTALHCTALHCTAPYYTAVHSSALQYPHTTLHNAAQSYSTIKQIALIGLCLQLLTGGNKALTSLFVFTAHGSQNKEGIMGEMFQIWLLLKNVVQQVTDILLS